MRENLFFSLIRKAEQTMTTSNNCDCDEDTVQIYIRVINCDSVRISFVYFHRLHFISHLTIAKEQDTKNYFKTHLINIHRRSFLRFMCRSISSLKGLLLKETSRKKNIFS